MELRLNEMFSILRQELEARKLSPYMNGGVVITGGGARIPAVLECARGVLRTHVRRGDPLEFSGAVTGLDDPRYAALLGALNYSIQIEGRGGSMIGIEKVADALEGLGGIFNKLKDVTKAFKI